MTGFIWIPVTFLGLFNLVIFGLSFVPRSQERTAERLARSVALILTPEVLPMVRRRVAQRTRGTTIGSVAGMLVGVVILSNDVSLAQSSLSGPFVLGMVFAGLSVGAAVTAAISGTQLRGDEVRFARSEATGLSDYVAPIERHGARIVVALVAAMLLLSLTLSVTGLANFAAPIPLTGGGILGVLAVAALVLFELHGRWIVSRGQRVGSPAQLSWDDALRSTLLRDLAMAPIALGFYGFVVAITELSHALAAAGTHQVGIMIAGNIGFSVALYAAILVGIFVIVSKPQRYFRLRLWPNLAEGL